MNNSSENFIKPLYQDDSDESDGPDDTSQHSDSPHAAQYIDEHDLDEEDEFEADRLKFTNSNVSNGHDLVDQEGVEDVNSAEDSDSSSQTSLNASYNSLPLAALAHASSRLDSTNDELNDDERKVNRAQALAKAKEDLWQKQQAKRGKSDTNKPDKVIKDTKDKHKRANKHAPTEITSRKPTSRKRDVVDVDKLKSRDPRFLSLSGNFSQDLFEKSFSFLKGSVEKEVSDVKDQLKAADLSLRRARALPSSTDDKQYLISHHQAEVDNLTQQIQSMSSQVRTSQKKDIEKDTLRKIKKEEREKISDGKKAYFLKDSEKRKRVEEAQKDALRAKGGNKAVKKSEERKRKRHEGKEKKSLPWSRDGGRDSTGLEPATFGWLVQLGLNPSMILEVQYSTIEPLKRPLR
ncbi:hypothetical protein E3P81_02071 [Wallemia ichthyophaga]|nr:hypothetical protein E3P97_02070 [Wallemia ichthyophaga]TIB33100.1 hypothetical protein E3P85_01524 [Wallemia ichthyophaga]TIB46746.1 hypothetical protein E3P82_02068 [Wallemia ichthyophaga]TIB50836.1 hypothetical protein E3P81_02071 [Wallemia ichthyophaga]TIB53563.1 hypothetical protein E3P80_02069 [Wallemia ichthyophaga]